MGQQLSKQVIELIPERERERERERKCVCVSENLGVRKSDCVCMRSGQDNNQLIPQIIKIFSFKNCLGCTIYLRKVCGEECLLLRFKPF